jgi:hypothetical protein
MSLMIETDARSRVVLPGARANRRYLVTEHEDGSLLLQPAVVKTEAQELYDHSPELQALLERASKSASVRRPRRERRTET